MLNCPLKITDSSGQQVLLSDIFLTQKDGCRQAGRFNHGFLWPGNSSGGPPFFIALNCHVKTWRSKVQTLMDPPFYKTSSYLQAPLVLSLLSSQSKMMIGLTVCVRPMMHVFTGTGSRDTAFTVSAQSVACAMWRIKAEGTRGWGEESRWKGGPKEKTRRKWLLNAGEF